MFALAANNKKAKPSNSRTVDLTSDDDKATPSNSRTVNLTSDGKE